MTVSMASWTLPKVFYQLKDYHYWHGFRVYRVQYQSDNDHGHSICPREYMVSESNLNTAKYYVDNVHEKLNCSMVVLAA